MMKELENTFPENDNIIIYRKEDISLEIGASLKDLGKKWFGFALLQDVGVDEIMGRIKSCR